MDAVTAAEFAQKAAVLNLGYTVFALFIIVGAFTMLAAFGEKALGLNLRKFIDNVESLAENGSAWPGVVVFILAPTCILGLVLFIGLR